MQSSQKPSTIMIRIFTVMLLALVVSAGTFAQSKSFMALQDEFRGGREVFSIRVSGFLARGVLRVAGEHYYVKAIRDVRQIRLITVPHGEFRAHGLTIEGYKKFVLKDNFEEVGSVRDHGDLVTLYMQGDKKSTNRYLMLVEDGGEFVAIEIKGYVDPKILLNNPEHVAYNEM